MWTMATWKAWCEGARPASWPSKTTSIWFSARPWKVRAALLTSKKGKRKWHCPLGAWRTDCVPVAWESGMGFYSQAPDSKGPWTWRRQKKNLHLFFSILLVKLGISFHYECRQQIIVVSTLSPLKSQYFHFLIQFFQKSWNITIFSQFCMYTRYYTYSLIFIFNVLIVKYVLHILKHLGNCILTSFVHL